MIREAKLVELPGGPHGTYAGPTISLVGFLA